MTANLALENLDHLLFCHNACEFPTKDTTCQDESSGPAFREGILRCSGGTFRAVMARRLLGGG